MSDAPRPPRRAERVVEVGLAGDAATDTILGDLHQEFDERVAGGGALRARAWYWLVALELAARYRLRALRRRLPGDAEGESRWRVGATDLLGELRYGFRMLRKTPLVSLAAILTIAVGIGMTVQTFSIVHGTALRGVPLPGGERLVQVRTKNPDTGSRNQSVPYHDFLEMRERVSAFESVGSVYTGTLNLAGEGGPPERYDGGWVSADSLSWLGVPPELGRVFLPGEDREGAEPLLVL
ncbi:MAG: ABC transporter permease, partial [Acidobacteriota bacterium]